MKNHCVNDLKHKIKTKKMNNYDLKNINSTGDNNSLSSRYSRTKRRAGKSDSRVKKSVILCSNKQCLSKDCENILKQESNISSIIKSIANDRISKKRYASQSRLCAEKLQSRSDKKGNVYLLSFLEKLNQIILKPRLQRKIQDGISHINTQLNVNDESLHSIKRKLNTRLEANAEKQSIYSSGFMSKKMSSPIPPINFPIKVNLNNKVMQRKIAANSKRFL
jgi:hypothetical protein